MTEMFTEKVNKWCDDNGDWVGLQGKLLDVTREVCGYSKANPDILKDDDGTEMWMWLYIGGIYIGSGDTIRKRKIEKNALKAKKGTKRIVMAMDSAAWDAVERVDSCHDMSYLELPNNEQGKSVMLLG